MADDEDRRQVAITIKNYRCFPDSRPLRLSLSRGFTSIVGVNNSGKSSILRFFWEFQGMLAALAHPGATHTETLAGRVQPSNYRVLPGEQVFSKLNDRDMTVAFEWTAADVVGESWSPIHHTVTATLQRSGTFVLDVAMDGARVAGASYNFPEGNILATDGTPKVDLTPFIDACRHLGGGLYLGPFRNTINVGATEMYFDMAVGQQFVGQFHQFKAGGDTASNEAIYRLIQDIKRIFGFSELDINPSPDGRSLQVFIDGRSFRLSELGTGIAQFILVLANVLVKRPTLVLIDEPETSLHPSLQLDFLTTLASYTQDASVMFATHNLGLARAASDQIYTCRRLELGVSEVRPFEATPHLAEFLGELGFSAYRDLGFDSVLLVEGPSDVKTVQQLLRLWHKDHQVVLLPLGGAGMINEKAEAELAEVARIGDKVAVLIDSERQSNGAPLAPDREGFVKVCDRLGLRVHVLERRAIENYLTDQAVKAAFGEAHAALGPYQLLSEADPGWGKRDNWRITRRMTEDELEGTDLGDFLSTL